jgi:hypothetical protein
VDADDGPCLSAIASLGILRGSDGSVYAWVSRCAGFGLVRTLARVKLKPTGRRPPTGSLPGPCPYGRRVMSRQTLKLSNCPDAVHQFGTSLEAPTLEVPEHQAQALRSTEVA